MKQLKKIRAAIFPDPYDENHWIRKYSPLLFEISERMRLQGVESIRVPEFPSLLWFILNWYRIDVIHFHWPDFYYYRSRYADHPIGQTILRIIKQITNENPFYLLARIWIFSFTALCRLFKIPLIWTLHDLYPHHQPSEYLTDEKKIRMYLMSRVDAVLFTCSSAVSISAKHFGTPRISAVAPFGSYRSFYPDTINRHFARKSLNLKEDDVLFLFFGNQRSRRNAIELSRSFSLLQYPNARLLIAGTTPVEIQKEIKKIAQNDSRIKCLFQLIPNNRIEYIFKACDYVVMPGEDYLSSGVILLAISYARPVIAQDFGCAREIIGDAGILFMNKEETMLYSLLDQAMTTDRKDLFTKAEVRASQLDWQITAEKTIEVYKIALKKYGFIF